METKKITVEFGHTDFNGRNNNSDSEFRTFEISYNTRNEFIIRVCSLVKKVFLEERPYYVCIEDYITVEVFMNFDGERGSTGSSSGAFTLSTSDCDYPVIKPNSIWYNYCNEIDKEISNIMDKLIENPSTEELTEAADRIQDGKVSSFVKELENSDHPREWLQGALWMLDNFTESSDIKGLKKRLKDIYDN